MGSGIFNRSSTTKRTLNHRYGQFGLLIMRSTRCSCIAFFVFGWEERPTQDTLLWAEGLSGTSLRCDLLSLGSRKEKEQHIFTAKASARYSRKRPDNKKSNPSKREIAQTANIPADVCYMLSPFQRKARGFLFSPRLRHHRQLPLGLKARRRNSYSRTRVYALRPALSRP